MAKKNFKKIIWTWDTSSWNREEMKEVFHEIYDRFPESEMELEDFIQSENDIYMEDEQSNVYFHERNHGQKLYVIEAECGLWWGRPTGYALKQGMWSAIAKCLQDYNTIYSFNGGVYVEASHHDGVNFCRIKELTQRGQDYYYRHHNNMDDAELLHHLFEDHHFSRNPKIFKEIYGW